MSAVWPASLPSDFILAHTDAPIPELASFQPLAGPPALYAVGDALTHMFSGRLRISDAQRLTFLEFYETTLARVRRFELASASFDGETWLCQFAVDNPYQLEGAGAGWWLTLSLVLVRRVL